MKSLFRWTRILALAAFAVVLTSCASMKQYRTKLPPEGSSTTCTDRADNCAQFATERHAKYDLHTIEFDDQGWLYADDKPGKMDQIDSAVQQIRKQLGDAEKCIHLFVYVHGWHHNAAFDDDNVGSFREFLSSRSDAVTAAGSAACIPTADVSVSRRRLLSDAQTGDSGGVRMSQMGNSPKGSAPTSKAVPIAKQGQVVGIYVGWRGDSFMAGTPLDVVSFWDRKNTAERVAQGAVRELFGRLEEISRPQGADDDGSSNQQRRLRTYVLAHSLGASIAFRALSQSMIDGFASEFESGGKASRFVDMLILLNPAIEAARFEPLYRLARKWGDACEAAGHPATQCKRPTYQAPLLAVFTAHDDWATHYAFSAGSSFSNFFEQLRSDGLGQIQRDANLNTIGWSDRYRTHTLKPGVDTCDGLADNEPFSKDSDGQVRYRAPGWRWCIDQMTLSHLVADTAAGNALAPYNGPIWNVLVENPIMRGHNHMWETQFKVILQRLFDNERQYQLQ